ncbi:hypothetical protein BHE74_00029912 [Ensete ventricosum]|nr:hypothetical protein BHE74_00029912 [Ensete ventricosum]
MSMNLKEGDRYVINHGEGLTAVDFGSNVSLAEKSMQHKVGTVELVEQKLSLDSESKYGGAKLGVQNHEVSWTMEECTSSKGRRRLISSIMPSQDRAPIKDADLEPMSMNLKKGGRCVVNHGEDVVDRLKFPAQRPRRDGMPDVTYPTIKLVFDPKWF